MDTRGMHSSCLFRWFPLLVFIFIFLGESASILQVGGPSHLPTHYPVLTSLTPPFLGSRLQKSPESPSWEEVGSRHITFLCYELVFSESRWLLGVSQHCCGAGFHVPCGRQHTVLWGAPLVVSRTCSSRLASEGLES